MNLPPLFNSGEEDQDDYTPPVRSMSGDENPVVTPEDAIPTEEEEVIPTDSDVDNITEEELESDDTKTVIRNPLTGKVEKIIDNATGEIFHTDDEEEEGGGEDTPSETPASELPEGIANHLHLQMRLFGYDGETVEIAPGVSKAFTDLSDEEQKALMVANTNQMLEYYEQELENARTNGAYRNEEEKAIIEHLRSGKSVRDLAEAILSHDPKFISKSLSDEDLLKTNYSKNFPDATEEDIAEMISGLSDTAKAKQATLLRAKMEREQPDLTGFAKQAEEERQRQVIAQQEQTKKQATEIIERAKALPEIAGFTLNEQIRNSLLSDVLPKTLDEDSPLVQSLSKPEDLLEIAFWRKYGKSIVTDFDKQLAQAKDEFYKKGRASVLGGLPVSKEKVVTTTKPVQAPVKKPATPPTDFTYVPKTATYQEGNLNVL